MQCECKSAIEYKHKQNIEMIEVELPNQNELQMRTVASNTAHLDQESPDGESNGSTPQNESTSDTVIELKDKTVIIGAN